MPASKRPSFDVPDLPFVFPQPEIEEVAQYLSAKHGSPKGTVLLAMFAVLSSLKSRSLVVNWQGESLRPAVQIFLLAGLSEPGASLLDFLIEPVRPVIESQNLNGVDARNAAGELEKFRMACSRYSRGTSLHTECQKRGRRLWDSIRSPRLLLRPLRKVDVCYDYSALMVGRNRDLVRTVNQDTSSAWLWMYIFCGRSDLEFGLSSPCTVLCYADRKDVLRFIQGEFGRHKSPIVLPGSHGQLGNRVLVHEKAQTAWIRLAAKAAAGWHAAPISVPIDQHGTYILSEIKSYTESIRAVGKNPHRYTWVLTTCVALAAVDNAIRKGGGEIHSDSWAFASGLTRWAVDAHTEFFRRADRGSPCSPQAEDESRLMARMQKTPSIKFWELLRALPRRPQGYWKQLHAVVTTRMKNSRTRESSCKPYGTSGDPSNPSDPRNSASVSHHPGDFGDATVNTDPFSWGSDNRPCSFPEKQHEGDPAASEKGQR